MKSLIIKHIQGIEELLTPMEVAALLKFPVKTIGNWARSGKLPYYKTGGKLRFRASEIEPFLQSNRAKTKEEITASHMEALNQANL